MDILSIGNSFSQDAQRYIHRIARADGVELNTFNLYIGGCSFSTHFRNMLGEAKLYDLEVNGVNTRFKVTLKEALLNRNWDVVTLQQVSHESPRYETYQPYLEKLAEYIRELVPKAKLAIHQTWAYENNSERLKVFAKYEDHKAMFADIKASYEKAAKSVNADIVIPSGELFGELLNCGIESVHRDTFHASLGLGRYAIGLLWYAVLTGKDVAENTFSDFDREIPEQQVNIAKECVAKVVKMYNC